MTAKRQRLAGRRKSLGYSQERLAVEVGVDRTTVGRWERGETDPQPCIRTRLCEALQITTGELDTLITAESDHEMLPATLREAPAVATPGLEQMGEPDDMHRREMLRLLSIAAVAAAIPGEGSATGNGRMGVADAEEYAAFNAHLWQVYGMSPAKRPVYPLVRQQLAVLTAHLSSGQPEAAHRQLCILACDLFQLAGEICFDGNRYTDAAHCYALAASVGRDAGSSDHWACALTRQAFVSMYDKQYGQAAEILSAAATVARHGDSQLSTRHWVAALHAQALAALGDQSESHRALDAASGVLDLAGPVSPGGWLRFDGSRLAEERGTCYLTAGQDADAEAALTEALSQGTSLRRRGSLLTDLAVLGVRQRDTDRLLHYLTAAVDIAEQAESPGYLGRKLRGLQTQIQPLVTDGRIAQLNDRIIQLPATV
jgi:transcriptional regulator with XRE-family HTH domain